MFQKFYAVARGRETGIFDNWDDCRAQTEGFKNSVFKSFGTLAEAEAWLKECGMDSLNTEFEDPPSGMEVENSTADYVVFTDGSCLKNPGGAGAYAAVIINNATKEQHEYVGGEESTTNNRMELAAAIAALENIPQGSSIDFYTDSQYLQNAFTRCWLQSWKRQGWLASSGLPVKNQDLWIKLDSLAETFKIKFHWVKGHAGNPLNELCDRLAYDEAMRIAGFEHNEQDVFDEDEKDDSYEQNLFDFVEDDYKDDRSVAVDFERALREPMIPIELAYKALVEGLLKEFYDTRNRANAVAGIRSFTKRKQKLETDFGNSNGVGLSDDAWAERNIACENMLMAGIESIRSQGKLVLKDFDGIFLGGQFVE